MFDLISSSAATEKTRTYLEHLGCDTKISNKELLKCAQSMNSNLVLNATTTYFFVIDEIVFPKSIKELAKEQAFKKCNIITGFNTEEYAFFTPFFGLFPLENPSVWEKIAKSVDFEKFSQMIPFMHQGVIQKNENFLETVMNEYFTEIELKNPNLTTINYFNYLNKIESGK